MPTTSPRPHRVLVLVAALTAVAIYGSASVALAQADDDTDTPAAQQSIGGTLTTQDGEPVAGVSVSVATEDGEPVGEDVSGEDGVWLVPLDEPGRYEVTIDPGTFPEGVELRDPDRTTLRPNVRPSANQSVVFQIGEREAGGTSRIDRLSNLAAEGVKFGVMIALAALGLSMVYGVTGLVNFAHGELLAFGAIIAFWLERGTGPLPAMPLILAGVVAIVATAGFAGLWEVGLFGPVRRRRSGDIAAMVISIGLALLARHLYLATYGSTRDNYLDFRLQSTPIQIGPVSLAPKAWASIIIATVVLLGVGWALRNTRLGTAMRAVSVNKDLAESSGIDVRRVTIATWVVGGALAGLSGVLFGLAESVRWNMGESILLLLFAAVVLGGLGTAYGAMLGGIVVGVVTQMSTYWFPADMKFLFALLVLVVILLVKPQGILGVRERFG